MTLLHVIGAYLYKGRMMKTSENGINLIKRFEGIKLKAYKPTPNDVWTIGYGHTDGIKQGDTITVEKATEYLRKDIQYFENAINTLVKVPLTQNQFDALVSFVFNIGVRAFKNSTMLKFLNANHMPLAAGQFDRWNKQKGVVLEGLTVRRRVEKELFLKEI